MKKRDIVLVTVLSCGAVAALIAAAIYLYIRKKRKREDDEDGTSCAIRVDSATEENRQKGLNRLNGFLNLKTPLISTKTLG